MGLEKRLAMQERTSRASPTGSAGVTNAPRRESRRREGHEGRPRPPHVAGGGRRHHQTFQEGVGGADARRRVAPPCGLPARRGEAPGHDQSAQRDEREDRAHGRRAADACLPSVRHFRFSSCPPSSLRVLRVDRPSPLPPSFVPRFVSSSPSCRPSVPPPGFLRAHLRRFVRFVSNRPSTLHASFVPAFVPSCPSCLPSSCAS